MELISFIRIFNAETQRRRVRREILELESGRLDDWVDCVEIFMQVSRPHSSIIYSRSPTERSDPFALPNRSIL